MSASSAGPPLSSLRRKVTIACESCRRRRVKCSGTLPCTFCSDSGYTCTFEDKQRGRRGPRPRQQLSQPHRVTYTLAPKTATGHGEGDAEENNSATLPTVPQHPEVTNTVDHDPFGSSEPPEVGMEDGGADKDGDNDQADSIALVDLPDVSLWLPALRSLFRKDAFASTVAHEAMNLDINLICHLIEMFCTRQSKQLRSVIDPNDLIQHICQGRASLSLILAICASSVCFSMHRTLREPSGLGFDKLLEKHARMRFSIGKETWQQIDNIRTICVLVSYGASQARGRQAWIDIATGKSLVQLARATLDFSQHDAQILDLAVSFLAAAEAAHTIGHATLRAGIDVRRNTLPHSLGSPSNAPQALSDLLRLYVYVEELCSRPPEKRGPPPWKPESEFGQIQIELEAYLVHYPGALRHEREYHMEQEPEEEDITVSVCFLVWHCCIIALNKAFLPVVDHVEKDKHECNDLPLHNMHLRAPALFVQERINRCEDSAGAICGIVRTIIEHHAFFSYPMLLGFACTQSALVLINQLHRASTTPETRLVDNLKLAFTVVGASQNYNASAQSWMDLLFHAHAKSPAYCRLTKEKTRKSGDWRESYSDIANLCFVPFDPKDNPDPNGPDLDQEKPAPDDSETKVAEDQSSNATNLITLQSSWIQDYAGHLTEDLECDNDADKAGGETTERAHLSETRSGGTDTHNSNQSSTERQAAVTRSVFEAEQGQYAGSEAILQERQNTSRQFQWDENDARDEIVQMRNGVFDPGRAGIWLGFQADGNELLPTFLLSPRSSGLVPSSTSMAPLSSLPMGGDLTTMPIPMPSPSQVWDELWHHDTLN